MNRTHTHATNQSAEGTITSRASQSQAQREGGCPPPEHPPTPHQFEQSLAVLAKIKAPDDILERKAKEAPRTGFPVTRAMTSLVNNKRVGLLTECRKGASDSIAFISHKKSIKPMQQPENVLGEE